MKDFLLKAVAQLTGKTVEEAKGILAELDQLRAENADLKAAAAGAAPDAVAALTTERDELAGQVAALTTERDGLAAQVATLTTERDGLRGQIQSVEDAVTAEMARLGMHKEELPGVETDGKGESGADATLALAKALLAEFDAAKGSKAQDAVWAKAKAAGINLREFAQTGKVSEDGADD